jgi:hypothetical protein
MVVKTSEIVNSVVKMAKSKICNEKSAEVHTTVHLRFAFGQIPDCTVQPSCKTLTLGMKIMVKILPKAYKKSTLL